MNKSIKIQHYNHFQAIYIPLFYWTGTWYKMIFYLLNFNTNTTKLFLTI